MYGVLNGSDENARTTSLFLLMTALRKRHAKVCICERGRAKEEQSVAHKVIIVVFTNTLIEQSGRIYRKIISPQKHGHTLLRLPAKTKASNEHRVESEKDLDKEG